MRLETFHTFHQNDILTKDQKTKQEFTIVMPGQKMHSCDVLLVFSALLASFVHWFLCFVVCLLVSAMGIGGEVSPKSGVSSP